MMLFFHPLKVLHSFWLVSFYKYLIGSVLISGSNSVMAADVFVAKFLLKILCANKFTNRSIFSRCRGTDNFEKVLSRMNAQF